MSNSPLDQVVEVGGLTGKNVFVVNLWAHKRALPRSIPEVLARCDEIVFAEKIRRNIHTWEHIDNYRKLVEEVMASLDPKTAEQISKRPATLRLSARLVHASPANGSRGSHRLEITNSLASPSTSTSRRAMP